MGSFANFHSVNTNITMKKPPRVSMEMTIGLEAGNCIPMPDIGIKSKMVPAELRKTPN